MKAHVEMHDGGVWAVSDQGAALELSLHRTVTVIAANPLGRVAMLKALVRQAQLETSLPNDHQVRPKRVRIGTDEMTAADAATARRLWGDKK
jgi:hypothetical protein